MASYDLFIFNGKTKRLASSGISITFSGIQLTTGAAVGLGLISDASGNASWARTRYVASVISANQTAVNLDELHVDTTGGAISVTLPSSPTLNDRIKLVDYAITWATNNVTVLRNGSLIEGVAADYTFSVNNSWAELVYTGATRGWKVLL